MDQHEHSVHFYESDANIVETVSHFAANGLDAGDAVVVIATKAHRDAIGEQLTARGIDLLAAQAQGTLIVLDSAELASEFLVRETLDTGRFFASVDSLLARAEAGGHRVRVYGEIVAALWAEGKGGVALLLEKLWNQVLASHPLELLCGYPLECFHREAHAEPFTRICAEHSRVIPGASYTDLPSGDQRLGAVAVLQQKARALEAENTARKELERSLVRRDQELADFCENAAEGLQTVGPDGIIQWVNKAQLDLLGYTASEYMDHHLAEFYLCREAFDAMWAELLRCGSLHDCPADLRCRDGSIKRVLIRSNVRWEDGRFVHTRCFIRDVTERWRLAEALAAKQQLTEAGRQKDEFLAMLAHELRNPLAPLHMAVELVRRHCPDETARHHLDTIDRQTERLTRLVDDLLDVSRITSGKIELRKQRADMAAIVSRAVEATRSLMEQRRHEVSVRVPAGPVELLVDPLRLEQVLVNLLVNAAKYTEPGGRVWVTLERTRDAIESRVQDSGIGLEGNLLEGVFDLFRQAERSLDRAQGGLGVGLTIARRLVELHGGTIEARSEGRGKGAELIVRLPPALEFSEASAIDASQVDPRRSAACDRLAILVVDDNVDAAETLSEILRNLGHEVRVAYDGESAILLAEEFRPNLVLLDIGLPGKDGYEVAKKLRAVGHEARLVAVTGYGQAKDRNRTAAAGFHAHLIKPVQMDVLASILEDAGWNGPC